MANFTISGGLSAKIPMLKNPVTLGLNVAEYTLYLTTPFYSGDMAIGYENVITFDPNTLDTLNFVANIECPDATNVDPGLVVPFFLYIDRGKPASNADTGFEMLDNGEASTSFTPNYFSATSYTNNNRYFLFTMFLVADEGNKWTVMAPTSNTW